MVIVTSYQKHSNRKLLEQWAGDVREPGVVLQCEPASGELRACTKIVVQVSVYADCWGLYHDQILIQIENLEPLILDVWIEAVGLPLEFALRPNDIQTQPTLWLSNTDPERAILIKNTSRADLLLHAFIIKEHEYPQDVLPFRLYVRLFDVPRPTCPCVTAYKSENGSSSESLFEDMDTSVELFLTSDHGVQDDTFFQVKPLECLIGAGERATYKLRLLSQHESAPDSVLLLRSTLVENTGDNWYRPDPALQFVRLRQTQRSPRLQASCSEINVNLCALDLPYNDVIRIRKRFNLQNIGDGQLEVYSMTEAPWSLDVARQICAAHCIPNETNKTERLKLSLPPRSATEAQKLRIKASSYMYICKMRIQIHLQYIIIIQMVVEVSVRTNEVWPEVDAKYLPRLVSSSALYFSDPDDAVLLVL
ncbi:unnamed protein product [Euphydryas editha]|uniref:Uncharacterized protein n=1 Tax=Euphydryas editha TaxID=104508 RepID=A0AAU9UBU9_EUPED|nr:unnamed protein product [Euphydryas editha]